MALLGIQIICIIFVFFMMYLVHIHYRKQELPRIETLFWFTSLTILALIIIIPDTAQFLTTTFSVNRLMDLIVIIALMVTFYMLVSMRIEMYKLNKKLEVKIRTKTLRSAPTK